MRREWQCGNYCNYSNATAVVAVVSTKYSY